MLLVTGGEAKNGDLSSFTEVASYDSDVLPEHLAWRKVGELPSPRRYLRAANLKNTLYVSGGEIADTSASRSVLIWLPSAEIFREIGTLSYGRYHHANIALKDPSVFPIYCI